MKNALLRIFGLTARFPLFAMPCKANCNRLPGAGELVPAVNEAESPVKAIGAINDLAPKDDWFRVVPFGEFPNPVGRQVIDRQSAEAMLAAFNSTATKLATLFRGLPIYEGHPDDAGWRQSNPGIRAVAVGRVKEMQVRDDGLWARAAWNDAGTALVKGDAPAYTAQSPHWGMLPIAGRSKTFRPVELFSLGLTNQPNIPGNMLGVNEAAAEKQNSAMKSKIIALLAAIGRPVANADTVTDDQLLTALNEATPVATQLVNANNELGTLKPKLSTAEQSVTALTADKNRLSSELATATNDVTTAKNSLKAEREARAENVLTVAINEGRITTAQRGDWKTKLVAATDFAATLGEIAKLKAINTRSQVSALGARKEESTADGDTITAINEAVAEKMSKGLSHDAAFAAVRKEKPDLFKSAAAS